MDDKKPPTDELRPDCNEAFLETGVRGKYVKRYEAASNVVRIAPDVAAVFPNEESVNEALRIVLRVMDETSRLTKRHAESEDSPKP